MSAGYPFSAIVGMDDLRLALLLNAVSPAVGGVLVRGEKGTAKSTTVRALAALLPEVAVVPGCRFACDPAAPDAACPDGPHPPAPSRAGDGADDASAGPGAAARRPARLVELPVGSSEDRLIGSLDLERALTEGVTAFEPGLLAAAHRGVLYVDEVNLLPDHLVDLLLDAAAMGTAHVEREGVSVRHAARFLLVGTMNPEEGELRPQLLDRFGLTVEVAASREPRRRAEVVRRRLAYEADPDGFAARWQQADAELAERIRTARALLPGVVLPDAELERVARVCAAFEVDGLRADLVTARAATALAAWHGRRRVEASDIRQAALLALPHRRRRNPFDAPGLDEDALDRALADPAPQPDPEPDPDPRGGGEPPARDAPAAGTGEQREGGEHRDGAGAGASAPPPRTPVGARDDAAAADAPPRDRHDAAGGPGAAAAPAVSGVGETFRPRLLAVDGLGAGAAGRRSRARTDGGRTTGARRPAGRLARCHPAATLLAAAPHQRARGRVGPGLLLRPGDLREAVSEGREANLILFVVDASGSMAARRRMAAVKGAVVSLLLDAYVRRDRVGLVTFRGAGAELALPPTSSVEVGAARLRQLATGGRTPLAAGLLAARDVLRQERTRDAARRPLVVLVTDGRATAALGAGEPLAQAHRAALELRAALAGPRVRGGGSAVVLDCEAGPVRLGLAGALADVLGARLLPLDALDAAAGPRGGGAQARAYRRGAA